MKTLPILCNTLAIFGIGIIGVSSFSLSAMAAIMYVESQDGELSSANDLPTFIGDLMEGDNFLDAAIINPPEGTQDRDYFKFTVPKGLKLDQIILENYQGGDDVSFIGIERGEKITPAPPTNLDEQREAAAQLLGYTLFGTRTTYDDTPQCTSLGVAGQELAPNTIVLVNQDLLPVLGIGDKPPLLTNCNPAFPTTGFTPPLRGNQTYSFWVQQTAGTGETLYRFKFVTSSTATAVPEPTLTLGFLAFGALTMSLKSKKETK